MERAHWIVERSAAQGKTVYEDREKFMRKQQEAQECVRWPRTPDLFGDATLCLAHPPRTPSFLGSSLSHKPRRRLIDARLRSDMWGIKFDPLVA